MSDGHIAKRCLQDPHVGCASVSQGHETRTLALKHRVGRGGNDDLHVIFFAKLFRTFGSPWKQCSSTSAEEKSPQRKSLRSFFPAVAEFDAATQQRLLRDENEDFQESLDRLSLMAWLNSTTSEEMRGAYSYAQPAACATALVRAARILKPSLMQCGGSLDKQLDHFKSFTSKAPAKQKDVAFILVMP